MAYTQQQLNEKFDEVIKRLSEGEKLSSVLLGKHPVMSTTLFYKILEEDATKSQLYARVKNDQIEKRFESIESDYMENPQRDPETGKIDPAWVNLQRLKIDSKKWELSKLMPKKYGDKLDVDAKLSGNIVIQMPEEANGLGE